jgi:WYL domain
MQPFLTVAPTLEDYWRGIILFGRNSASYKFALAKSLLELNPQAGQLLKLTDLAPAFAKHIVTHLKQSPKQALSASSQYLDAYCHLREGLRSFALDAINGVQLKEKPAKGVTEAELHEMFETSYGIFSGKNKQVAKLKFTPFRAQWVAREVWHPEQVGQVHPDGSYTLEVPYGEDWELIQDILRQGQDVNVLAPESLKNKVKEVLKITLAQY